jgi:hypothetical protein
VDGDREVLPLDSRTTSRAQLEETIRQATELMQISMEWLKGRRPLFRQGQMDTAITNLLQPRQASHQCAYCDASHTNEHCLLPWDPHLRLGERREWLRERPRAVISRDD